MSEPYYKDDLVTLFHGDCLEVAEWLDADVLVTDPPYGMGYTDRSGSTVASDCSTAARDSALTAWGTKPWVMFGTWKIERPISTSQVIIWDKWGGGGTVTYGWSPWDFSHEEIYVGGNWPKRPSGGRAREGGNPSISSGVLRTPKYNPASRPAHPTPKPVSLMESVLKKVPSGVIADPFAGSGATLLAALNLGRPSIGVELEERYCELIAKRLSQQAFDFGSLEDEVRASGWANV